MDILKKMFGLNGNEKDAPNENKSKTPSFGNEFRKPVWYDEESDDELFDSNRKMGFQVFTNPLEMQKYYEAQMKEMFKTLEHLDEQDQMFDENAREEYMKPGFEDAVSKEAKAKKSIDTDLDGEIYADQLHSLLQRVTPELNQMIAIDSLNKSRRANAEKPQETVRETRKLTDDEKVWNKIINIPEGDEPKKSSARQQIARQIPHHGGAFEGLVDGPKTFRQGYTFQMIRKPGGICETRKTVIDADGNTKTVVKRTVDGKTETTTVVNGLNDNGNRLEAPKDDDGPTARNNIGLSCGRELNVTKDGYILPKNLW